MVWKEPSGDGGEEENGTEHVKEEHEGEENAHIGLKFEGGKYPCTDPDGEGESGKDDGATGVAKGIGERFFKENAAAHEFTQAEEEVDAIIDADSDAESDDRQGRDLQPNVEFTHYRVGHDRNDGERCHDTKSGPP